MPVSEFNSDFDQNSAFNDWIDSRNEPVILEKREGEKPRFEYFASEVIYHTDAQFYQELYSEFERRTLKAKKEELDRFKQAVLARYPCLIAYRFWRFEHWVQDQSQRPELMRDVWEAIIYVLHALVMAQFRQSRSVDLCHTNMRLDNLLDFGLDAKLTLVKSFLNRKDTIISEMSCLEIISEDLLNCLGSLNRIRNHFAHGSALNLEQRDQLVTAHYEELLEALRLAQGLQDVHLLRFHGSPDTPLQIRVEKFMGHHLQYPIETENIDSTELSRNAVYLNRHNILIRFRGQIYNASPFLCVRQNSTHHHTEVSYFKQVKQGQYHFETVGNSNPELHDPASFSTEIAELQSKLRP